MGRAAQRKWTQRANRYRAAVASQSIKSLAIVRGFRSLFGRSRRFWRAVQAS